MYGRVGATLGRGVSVGVSDGISVLEGVNVGSGEEVKVGVKTLVGDEVTEGVGLSRTITFAVWQATSVNASKETISLIVLMMN